MPSSRAASLENKLAEQVSVLTPTQKKELLDFATFLATRRQSGRPHKISSMEVFSSIIGIAPGGAGETYIAANHDKYLYGEDPL